MSFTDRDNAASSNLSSSMPYIHDPEPPLSASVHNNLSSSVPSLSSSRSQASQIAKTYRQAANLFLTRRLPEALSTIEPIIRPPGEEEAQNGGETAYSSGSAPIALASRGSRIKVWVFWLTFLSAVVELGPEEGKHAFGSTRWKELVSKARDGTVWEEIVRYGYGGIEGNVDAEVVVNLYVSYLEVWIWFANVVVGLRCCWHIRLRRCIIRGVWRRIYRLLRIRLLI